MMAFQHEIQQSSLEKSSFYHHSYDIMSKYTFFEENLDCTSFQMEQKEQNHNLMNKVVILRKDNELKRFISGLLHLRRQKERQQSYLQICEDHQKFKIMKQWKKIIESFLKKRIQSQLLLEKKIFDLKRNCFKGWSVIIKNKEKATMHYKKRIFTSFKYICASQLSTRLKKIEVAEILIKKRLSQFLHNLTLQWHQYRQKYGRALMYHENSLKERFFYLYKQNSEIIKTKLNNKQNKLAKLHFKHKTNAKIFKILLSSHIQNQ